MQTALGGRLVHLHGFAADRLGGAKLFHKHATQIPRLRHLLLPPRLRHLLLPQRRLQHPCVIVDASEEAGAIHVAMDATTQPAQFQGFVHGQIQLAIVTPVTGLIPAVVLLRKDRPDIMRLFIALMVEELGQIRHVTKIPTLRLLALTRAAARRGLELRVILQPA